MDWNRLRLENFLQISWIPFWVLLVTISGWQPSHGYKHFGGVYEYELDLTIRTFFSLIWNLWWGWIEKLFRHIHIFRRRIQESASLWVFFRRILKPQLDFLSPRFVYGPTLGLIFLGSCVVRFGFVQGWAMFFFWLAQGFPTTTFQFFNIQVLVSGERRPVGECYSQFRVIMPWNAIVSCQMLQPVHTGKNFANCKQIISHIFFSNGKRWSVPLLF